MPIIRPPRSNPQPTEDVRGPNFPESVDPGFDDAYRNPRGDVGSVRDFVGQKPEKKPGPPRNIILPG